jgi:hypothetical protein
MVQKCLGGASYGSWIQFCHLDARSIMVMAVRSSAVTRPPKQGSRLEASPEKPLKVQRPVSADLPFALILDSALNPRPCWDAKCSQRIGYKTFLPATTGDLQLSQGVVRRCVTVSNYNNVDRQLDKSGFETRVGFRYLVELEDKVEPIRASLLDGPLNLQDRISTALEWDGVVNDWAVIP